MWPPFTFSTPNLAPFPTWSTTSTNLLTGTQKSPSALPLLTGTGANKIYLISNLRSLLHVIWVHFSTTIAILILMLYIHFCYLVFMAIPIISFPRVRTIYIYIYVCVTCASMCCICIWRSCVIPGGGRGGLGQLIGVAHKRTRAWASEWVQTSRKNVNWHCRSHCYLTAEKSHFWHHLLQVSLTINNNNTESLRDSLLVQKLRLFIYNTREQSRILNKNILAQNSLYYQRC